MALRSVMPHTPINTTEFFNVTCNCAMQIKRGMGWSITTLICSHLVYRVIQNNCRGFNNLPPRSPDATPCDFFLWGYVKD